MVLVLKMCLDLLLPEREGKGKGEERSDDREIDKEGDS